MLPVKMLIYGNVLKGVGGGDSISIFKKIVKTTKHLENILLLL